jgi:hypothetical protein
MVTSKKIVHACLMTGILQEKLKTKDLQESGPFYLMRAHRKFNVIGLH